MERAARTHFDHVFDAVLRTLPREFEQLLSAVPVHVMDRPAPELLAEMGMDHGQALLGLYTGVPLADRGYDWSGEPSELIMIFREPLLEVARDRRGRIHDPKLAEQIRITLLHELGHHYGLDEERLEALGYG